MTRSNDSRWLQRLIWFVLLWAAGVASVLAVAFIIRLAVVS